MLLGEGQDAPSGVLIVVLVVVTAVVVVGSFRLTAVAVYNSSGRNLRGTIVNRTKYCW